MLLGFCVWKVVGLELNIETYGLNFP